MLEGVDTYDALGERKPVKVLVNGCFDILHVGHIEHLRQAATLGDQLVVSLTADEHIGKGPGRPVNRWEDRRDVLLGVTYVSDVVKTDSAVSAILEHRPQVFVKGIDYASNDKWSEDVLSACVKVGAILAFTTTAKQSATDIIRRVNELSRNR